MRMSEGVEWALHTCVNLTWAESSEAVTTARLAALYELPPAYLNKHLQALVRAGILPATPGPRGGFRLARAPEKVTMLDVVTAVEGAGPAFRCESILGKGPGGDPRVDYREVCAIARAMGRAEAAYREQLGSVTLADLKQTVERSYPSAPRETRIGLELETT
jgi:Rrf2 family protein